MEFPGTRLTRPIRLAILITFVAAFFIISPVVILLSAGFRFDLRNGLLKETGSLSVDVVPQTASVYLDGIKIDQSIPIRLNNITPHKYTLRLSAPGYYEWEKNIEVNKNQTTYIKGLILIKKNSPVNISDEKATQLSISPSGKYLAYTILNRNNTDVFVRDETTNSKTRIMTIQNEQKIELNWSPLGDFLAISTEKKPHNFLYIINAGSTNKINPINLGEKQTVNKYLWSKDAEPKLYYENDGQIRSYLPRLDQNNAITTSTFQDWYVSEGSLWAIDVSTSTGGLTITSDYLGFKNQFFSILPNDNLTSSSFKKFTISSVNKKVVILNNSDSEKYYIISKDRLYIVNGRNFLYSKFNNWLLLWTPWELWTYSDGDEPYLLNRSGDELLNVVPLDEFNTLAMEWKNNVTILHPYFLTQRTVIDGPVNSLSANTQTRTLYYSNKEGLWKLNY